LIARSSVRLFSSSHPIRPDRRRDRRASFFALLGRLAKRGDASCFSRLERTTCQVQVVWRRRRIGGSSTATLFSALLAKTDFVFQRSQHAGEKERSHRFSYEPALSLTGVRTNRPSYRKERRRSTQRQNGSAPLTRRQPFERRIRHMRFDRDAVRQCI